MQSGADWLVQGRQKDDWTRATMSALSVTAWGSRSDVKNKQAAKKKNVPMSLICLKFVTPIKEIISVHALRISKERLHTSPLVTNMCAVKLFFTQVFFHTRANLWASSHFTWTKATLVQENQRETGRCLLLKFSTFTVIFNLTTYCMLEGAVISSP